MSKARTSELEMRRVLVVTALQGIEVLVNGGGGICDNHVGFALLISPLHAAKTMAIAVANDTAMPLEVQVTKERPCVVGTYVQLGSHVKIRNLDRVQTSLAFEITVPASVTAAKDKLFHFENKGMEAVDVLITSMSSAVTGNTTKWIMIVTGAKHDFERCGSEALAVRRADGTRAGMAVSPGMTVCLGMTMCHRDMRVYVTTPKRDHMRGQLRGECDSDSRPAGPMRSAGADRSRKHRR
ncbi:hypothetical protein GGF31_008778 [Allomyces arbusculus]|nr:hypothetical protein GGF31_008778 [Allomyces arbusculus]